MGDLGVERVERDWEYWRVRQRREMLRGLPDLTLLGLLGESRGVLRRGAFGWDKFELKGELDRRGGMG